MIKHSLKALLGLSLIAGCAGEDQAPEKSPAAQKQQGVRSADAAGKLMAFSNASIRATAIGQRSNVDLDLAAEIEAGIEEFIAQVEDADCLTYTVEPVGETGVKVDFDFDQCIADGYEVDGGFDVDVEFDLEDGSVDCDYDADFVIDDVDIDGAWSIDISEAGTGVIEGSFDMVLPDGSSLSTLIDASWKLGGLCPELTQHIELSEAGVETFDVDLSGLDLCAASLCESSVEVALQDAAVDLNDASDLGISCASGDLDWSTPDLDIDPELPETDIDPELPETDIDPELPETDSGSDSDA